VRERHSRVSSITLCFAVVLYHSPEKRSTTARGLVRYFSPIHHPSLCRNATFPFGLVPALRIAFLAALATWPLHAQASSRADATTDSAKAEEHPDPRWAPIRRIFGQEGETEGPYFRVNLPRSDLHVRIGKDELSPDFEFTSYVGFMPAGATDVMAMGEVILRDDEVVAALEEAHRQVVQVTAVHNHLLGETPRIVYLHVMVRGAPDVRGGVEVRDDPAPPDQLG
jgi:hypothetical protein